jgi:hypothetical protein
MPNGDMIGPMLAAQSSWYEGMIAQATYQAGGLIQQAAQYTAGVYNSSNAWAQDAVGLINHWMADTSNALGNGVAQVLGSVTEYIQLATSTLYDVASEALKNVTTGLRMMLSALEEATRGVVSGIGNFMSDVMEGLKITVSTIIDGAKWLFTEAVTYFKEVARTVTDAVGQMLIEVRKAAIDITKEVVSSASQFYVELQKTIQNEYEVLLKGSESILSTVEERIGSLSDAFDKAAKQLSETMEKVGKEMMPDLTDLFKPLIGIFAPDIEPGERDKILRTWDKFTRGDWTPEFLDKFWGEEWMTMIIHESIWNHLFFAIMLVMGTIPFVWNAATIHAQRQTQQLALTYPWMAMPPQDAAAAYVRGTYGKSYAAQEIRKGGFSEDQANVMLDNVMGPPGLGDLIDQWRRGIITEQELESSLTAGGINPKYHRAIKQQAETIPGVQDLILMAVREALTPEIAERFGQYQDFPPQLAARGKLLGLSEETCRMFWAAHWNLPSPQMAFEMWQRRIITDPEEMNMLMRALDIMPHWREKLLQLAYVPLTRVDVRRMHKMGVLTDEEVYNSYLDHGYSPENAARMRDFTIAYNSKGTEDETELGKLTRSSILNFYDDGLLDRTDAHRLLVKAGYKDEAAKLYLDRVDFEDQRAERKAETALIIEQAQAGVVTFEAAQDKLRALGLGSVELDKAVAALIRAQERKVKIPSRTEGEKMFELGVVTENEYRLLLSDIGYSNEWIQKYIEKSKKEMSIAENKRSTKTGAG